MSLRPLSRAAVAVAALALLASACSGGGGEPASSAKPPAGALAVGSTAHSIVVGSVQRSYRVYRPATLASPAPLVVMLHGALGSGAQAESSYGWDAAADAGDFVVAYPDGLHRTWNAGGICCGPAAADHDADVQFIEDMVAAVEALVPVDRSRIYATGISNGGVMSYRLACDTKIFAAIGPDSATMTDPCTDPAPVSVIHVHGLADQTVPFVGGAVTIGGYPLLWPPVSGVIGRWLAVDRCAAPSSTSRGPVTTSLATCLDGRAVELITIAGAGHQWPGGEPDTPAEKLLGLAEPSTALNATATIWAFFAAHPGKAT